MPIGFVNDGETAEQFYERCLVDSWPVQALVEVLKDPPAHWDDSETLTFCRLMLAWVVTQMTT